LEDQTTPAAKKAIEEVRKKLGLKSKKVFNIETVH
jgi:hypothetical protein